MTATDFGTLPDGRPVRRVTLSAHGLTASVISWGASLQDLRLDGIAQPLVLGFPNWPPTWPKAAISAPSSGAAPTASRGAGRCWTARR